MSRATDTTSVRTPWTASGWTKATCRPKRPRRGDGVDQLRPGRREVVECGRDVVHLVGDVVDAGAAPGEEAPHRGVLAGRGEQLDPARADEHRGGLDALVGDDRAVLERSPEEPRIGIDGFVEVGDGEADMVDTARLHCSDATSRLAARGRGSQP